MARQSTTPVQFEQSTRQDTAITMTTGRAGVVMPFGYIPLHAGDSCSGRVGIDIQLKEMPKPLHNGVMANLQAWFVPKSAHPQFPGRDELNHARTGEVIKSLGAADRAPPPFYNVISGAALATVAASDFFKAVGIHVPAGSSINSDLIDAFNVIYNFRLASHSSRLTRRKYFAEDPAESTSLPPAFWPSSRLSAVVPDYERALLLGSFDLDVAAGSLEITGSLTRDVTIKAGAAGRQGVLRKKSDGTGSGAIDGNNFLVNSGNSMSGSPAGALYYDPAGGMEVSLAGLMIENTGGAGIPVTLADIDKARTTQAFSKLRNAYAGNDFNGFDNDDTIVSLLMQGINVRQDDFDRPWLLDSKRIPINFAERFATDAANLDQSVTLGRASAMLSLNVPKQDVSGVIIFTCEVLPERVDERMSDEWLLCTEYKDLPDALRDVQRPEPVDLVPNRRIDAKHSLPNGLYGYEPMNAKWNRDFTRLGGEFFQPTPGAGWTETRSTIWQTEIVDPTFSATHFLAPQPFPHDVFADTEGAAFELVARHSVAITGLTQIGDVLHENNDDYEAVTSAGQ